MELVSYDKATKTSTITITDEELVDIRSVLGGVKSTFSKQDSTILGIDEPRLKLLNQQVLNIISARRNK